jgi:hypothetical protein
MRLGRHKNTKAQKYKYMQLIDNIMTIIFSVSVISWQIFVIHTF